MKNEQFFKKKDMDDYIFSIVSLKKSPTTRGGKRKKTPKIQQNWHPKKTKPNAKPTVPFQILTEDTAEQLTWQLKISRTRDVYLDRDLRCQPEPNALVWNKNTLQLEFTNMVVNSWIAVAVGAH